MFHHRVGCDAHKRYSQFAILDQDGQLRQQTRVDHDSGAIQAFLESLPEGTLVALESVGNWYSRTDAGTVWIADEIEAAEQLQHWRSDHCRSRGLAFRRAPAEGDR